MLDLSRYVGRWIEIARLPNWFEHGAFATADYSLTTDGIQVVNTSFDERGQPVSSITGLARQIGPSTLEVRFPGSPWAEYKVEWVSEDYGLAIVGNSARSSLWILSRSRISHASLEALLSLARRFGYSVDRVLINVPTLVEDW
jgi:apolipoprotein D and lipocalin family protein